MKQILVLLMGVFFVLETKMKSMQDEMRRKEEMEERELLERLRQPREIELRRNIYDDFEFDDDELY